MAEKQKISPNAMYVAQESFVTGEGVAYHKDRTRASGKLISKNGWEHLFALAEVSHPEIEAATAGPGEKR